jgi:hypothetical protein
MRGVVDDRVYVNVRKIPSAAGIYPVSIDLNGQQLKSSFKVKPFNWIPVFDAEFNDVLDAQKFVWGSTYWKIGPAYGQPEVGMVGLTGPSNTAAIPWAAYVPPELMTPPGPVTNGMIQFRVRHYSRFVAGGAEIYMCPCVLFRLTGVPQIQGYHCDNGYFLRLDMYGLRLVNPNETRIAFPTGFAADTWYEIRIIWQDGYSPLGVPATVFDMELYRNGAWVSLGRFYDNMRWGYNSATNMVAIGMVGVRQSGPSDLTCAGFDYFRVWRREPL